MERDYLAPDGLTDAARYQRLSDKLDQQQQAAEAEAQRHRAQVEMLTAEVEALDTDSELRRRLRDLRLAVAGKITDSEGITALRAALTASFDRVVLHIQDGKPYLVPFLREDALKLGAEFSDVSAEARRIPLGYPTQERAEWTPPRSSTLRR